MTKDFVMLRPLKKVASYEGMVCKIPGCDKRPRRNGYCDRCSVKVREGTLLPDGSANYKRVLKYSKDYRCFICGTGGKIVKGMCRKHYYELEHGYIDFDGVPTGKVRLRVASYKGVKCKFPPCYKQARSRGFCTNHFDNYQSGYLDINGKTLKVMPIKNKGRKCKVCDRAARTAGYCVKHYTRKKKGLPLLDKDFYVNKGKTCCVERCTRNARIKGYCDTHYYRLCNDIPMTGPVRAVCHCGKLALAKGLCSSHYEKQRRERWKKSTSTTESTSSSSSP